MSTFEVVRGPEGDCLLLDDTRISGPKPWGGGTVTKTFRTDKAYDVVPKDELDRLKAENAELRELAENLLMGFVYLETPQEQQSCIDHALHLRRELDVLPMEEFDARKLGVEVPE